MRRIHRLGLAMMILISCLGCDQATKRVAREKLASAAPISWLNDAVRIEYTENSGAFLGVGANWPSETRFLVFVVFVGVVLSLTLVAIVHMRGFSVMQLVGLSLVAAGGIGNLLDRVFNHGVVIDFMRLGLGPVRTGVFNVADVAIMVGVPLALWFSAKGGAKGTPA